MLIIFQRSTLLIAVIAGIFLSNYSEAYSGKAAEAALDSLFVKAKQFAKDNEAKEFTGDSLRTYVELLHKDAKLKWPVVETGAVDANCKKTDAVLRKEYLEFLEGFIGVASIFAWNRAEAEGADLIYDIVDTNDANRDTYDISLMLSPDIKETFPELWEFSEIRDDRPDARGLLLKCRVSCPKETKRADFAKCDIVPKKAVSIPNLKKIMKYFEPDSTALISNH